MTAPTPAGSLSGARAVVTGASRNIGRDIALHLADCGADVAVVARTASPALDAVADELRARGARAVAVAADLADGDAVAAAFSRIRDELGEVDVLVNNAALRPLHAFVDLPYEEWRAVFAANVDSAFHCMQQVVPSMVRRGGGAIVNINAIVAYIGGRFPAVVASKSALLGLTRAAAVELAPAGVRVNTVALGPVETVRAPDFDHSVLDAEVAATPLGRLGRGRDVAEACAFLASDAASYITGQTIHVNGGRLML